MLKCYKGFSLINEFYNSGSSGGVASTLGFIALKFGFCKGIVTLDRTVFPPVWFIAKNKEDLIKSCGSTYEYVKFNSLPFEFSFPFVGQIGKPCDMNPLFSPNISLFCSHSYRSRSEIVSKKYAGSPKSKLRTLLENPVKCFLCLDHLGYVADVNVGDDQGDPKLNNVIVRSSVGLDLINLGIDNNLLKIEEMRCINIKKKQKYLWR